MARIDRPVGYRVDLIEYERGWGSKTGEFYNPQEAFDRLMNKPEIMAVFKRLAVR